MNKKIILGITLLFVSFATFTFAFNFKFFSTDTCSLCGVKATHNSISVLGMNIDDQDIMFTVENNSNVDRFIPTQKREGWESFKNAVKSGNLINSMFISERTINYRYKKGVTYTFNNTLTCPSGSYEEYKFSDSCEGYDYSDCDGVTSCINTSQTNESCTYKSEDKWSGDCRLLTHTCTKSLKHIKCTFTQNVE